MSGVNSPLGAKQNCPSPNTADTQNNPKMFERVSLPFLKSAACNRPFSYLPRGIFVSHCEHTFTLAGV